MKPKPLNLRISSIKKTSIKGFRGFEAIDVDGVKFICETVIRQQIKSACEFYFQYKNNPEKFLDEHPEYTEEVCEKCGHPYVIYEDLFNDWLFKLVFKSVLEDDK